MQKTKLSYTELNARVAQLEEVMRCANIPIPTMESKSYAVARNSIGRDTMPDLLHDTIDIPSRFPDKVFCSSLLDLIDYAVVLYNTQGTRVFANATYFAMHGYSQNTPFDAPYSRFVHPEDIAVYSSLENKYLDAQKHNIEYRFRHNLGYWMVLQKTMHCVYNEQNEALYCVAIIKNQTEEKRTERALTATNTFIEKIINTSPSITYIYDIDDKRNIFINNGLSRLLGYGSSEIEEGGDEILNRLIHPDDLPRALEHQKQFGSALDNEILEVEYMFRHKNGEWRWLHSWESVFLRKKNGKVKQISGVLLDVTEQKRTEQALKQNERSLKRQNEELFEAKRKAENADKLKSAFLANMSHEIRTPMNGIVGFAQLLANESISLEKRRYYTDVITKSGQQLLAIIGDIMDISKIETGQVKIQAEATSINALWHDLQALYQPLTAEKKLQIRFHSGFDDTDCIISVDKTKLAQIITNLINNSLKFTQQGGIEIGYTLQEGELLFWVRDTGVGIPTEMLAAVFDRFYQVESNAKHYNGGTGLGLSICKAFVELMGGRIWVESAVGQGSCFSFVLPWIPIASVRETKAVKMTQALEATTLIVAEDEDINYQYIEEIYRNTPIQILRACSGSETIKLLNEHPETSMILMDIRMPDMNGYDATIEIRKTNQFLPIVAVTAFALSEDRQRFLPAGFTDYIAKPYTKEQIDEVLERYCNN